MLDNPMHPRKRRREQWQESLVQAMKSPRCGAKTRQGKDCRSPAMKNGRCRMHGGKSSGAPLGSAHGLFKHGFYTKQSLKLHKDMKKVLTETFTLINR